MITGIPVIDPGACDACGSCVEWCPTGAVGIVDGKAVIVKFSREWYGTESEKVCPAGAVKCPFSIVLVQNKPEGNTEKPE